MSYSVKFKLVDTCTISQILSTQVEKLPAHYLKKKKNGHTSKILSPQHSRLHGATSNICKKYFTDYTSLSTLTMTCIPLHLM